MTYLHQFLAFADFSPMMEDDMTAPLHEPAEPARFVEPVETDLPSRFTHGLPRQFEEKILAMMDKGVRNFVVRCVHVETIDLRGWGVLIRLSRHVHQHGGALDLRGLSPSLLANMEAAIRIGRIRVDQPTQHAPERPPPSP